MLDAVHKGDFEEPITKLSQRVVNITLTFITFCDGCLDYMMEAFFLDGKTDVRIVELTDLSHRDQMTLPFFV